MNRTINPLGIELGPSRLLAAGLVAAYGTALIVIITTGLPAVITGVASGLLLITCWRDVAGCSRRGEKQRIRRLVLNAERDWIIVNGAGARTQGRPVGARVAHPWAVSFTLTDGAGRRNPVLVLPDMTSRRSYHALRLWLRQNSQAVVHGRHT